MNLYEFQAKELLGRFGIAVPQGRIAAGGEDAGRVARRMASARYVVKAQVHAGDRAAGGGIRFAGDPGEVARHAGQLVGQPLVTQQTGPAGQLVRWVYVEEMVEARRHIFAAVALDRTSGRLALLVGAEGGDDIEARFASDRSAVQVFPLQLGATTAEGDFAGAAAAIGLSGSEADAAARLFAQLAAAAVALDATLVEVNPLALTGDGRLIALDAKITIDDNALPRHPDLARLRDVTVAEDGDPLELAAQAHQLNYQRMDGEIGVVVNGAGLALATLDALIEAGGTPANFMDIRTTASSIDIAYGFGLILANPRARTVLVNVHGGGMQRCDTIAEGIGIASAHAAGMPRLIVRFAGNNAEFGIERLASYGLAFDVADDIGAAVAAAVSAGRREAA